MSHSIFERGCDFCRMLSVWATDAPPPLKCQHCGAPAHRLAQRNCEGRELHYPTGTMGVATATAVNMGPLLSYDPFYAQRHMRDDWSAEIEVAR